MGKLSIVIPVYFNEKTLISTVESIQNDVVPYVDECEIIMVSDGSGDNSWEVMKTIKRDNHNVKIMKLSRNFGSHAAVMAGFGVATGDCVVSKAADMQEPADLLVKMYREWKKGNKVVLAVRKKRQESKIKVAFANFYYFLIRKLALKNMPANGFDICMLDRQVVNLLNEMGEKNSAITMQVLWSGFQTCQVEYVRLPRVEGKSRWTFQKKIKLVIDSLVNFSYVPMRVMTGLGAGFIAFSFIWGIRILISVCSGKMEIRGWASIMLVLLFVGGIIMFSLGVLGEYVWRTLEETRKRPLYIIDELFE